MNFRIKFTSGVKYAPITKIKKQFKRIPALVAKDKSRNLKTYIPVVKKKNRIHSQVRLFYI